MQRPPNAGNRILRVKTPQYTHNGIAFSPYFEDRIAVASGTNFGLIGNGRVHILQLGPSGLQVAKYFDTQDCVYDVAWNESHENQVIAACGNGALRLFDITLDGFPVKAWHEHQAEIMSVEWSNLQKDTFVTASWDQTIKIWTVDRATSLLTIPAHNGQIFKASWSPNIPSLIATTGADGFVNMFDIRSRTPERPVTSTKASETDILDLDWNKYTMGTIATAGKDGAIRIWDTRASGARPSGELRGHRLAVRKVMWSPHHRDVLSTTSYDMTCRIWNSVTQKEQLVHSDHTEFVMGTAWSLFDAGLVGTCGWDESVHAFRA